MTVKIPLSDLRRIPEANRSEFIRSAVSEKLAREPASEWKPKTATGRKLLALREKFIRSGGELLDSDDERIQLEAAKAILDRHLGPPAIQADLTLRGDASAAHFQALLEMARKRRAELIDLDEREVLDVTPCPSDPNQPDL